MANSDLTYDPHGGEPRRLHRSKDGPLDWLETSDEFVGGHHGPGFVEAFLKTIDCYVMGSEPMRTAFGLKPKGWVVYGDKPTFSSLARTTTDPG